jgi:hypothetical protein
MDVIPEVDYVIKYIEEKWSVYVIIYSVESAILCDSDLTIL